MVAKQKKQKKQINQKKQVYKKKHIPKAIRNLIWVYYNGRCYDSKCYISWCPIMIDCEHYHCGHNIPESRGGKNTLDNIKPICSSCNLSMGNRMTIDEWEKYGVSMHIDKKRHKLQSQLYSKKTK